MPHCDFCHALIQDLSVCKTIEGKPVTINISNDEQETKLHYTADWLVCPICAHLILNSKWEALVYRFMSENGLLKTNPEAELWIRLAWSKAFELSDLLHSISAA